MYSYNFWHPPKPRHLDPHCQNLAPILSSTMMPMTRQGPPPLYHTSEHRKDGPRCCLPPHSMDPPRRSTTGSSMSTHQFSSFQNLISKKSEILSALPLRFDRTFTYSIGGPSDLIDAQACHVGWITHLHSRNNCFTCQYVFSDCWSGFIILFLRYYPDNRCWR
jgi:hypothetical protein